MPYRSLSRIPELQNQIRALLQSSELVMYLRSCIEILTDVEDTGLPPEEEDFGVLIDAYGKMKDVLSDLADLGDEEKFLEEQEDDLG